MKLSKNSCVAQLKKSKLILGNFKETVPNFINENKHAPIATVFNDDGNLKVLFHNKVQGIAPGQSAAFYNGNDLVAGGFIMKK